jgi:hypothetical protein
MTASEDEEKMLRKILLTGKIIMLSVVPLKEI